MNQLKSEYVSANLSRTDKLKLRSIFVAPGILFSFVLHGLWFGGGDFSYDSGRIVTSLFIITGVASGVLHWQAQKKVNLLIEKYDREILGGRKI